MFYFTPGKTTVLLKTFNAVTTTAAENCLNEAHMAVNIAGF